MCEFSLRVSSSKEVKSQFRFFFYPLPPIHVFLSGWGRTLLLSKWISHQETVRIYSSGLRTWSSHFPTEIVWSGLSKCQTTCDGQGVLMHVCAPLCMYVDINLSVCLSACILFKEENSKGKSQWIFWYFFLLYFPESLSACCRQGIGQAAVSSVRAECREGKAQPRGLTVGEGGA